MPSKKVSSPSFHASQRLQKSYEAGIKKITGKVIVAPKLGQSLTEWLGELVKRSQDHDVQAASELLARRMVFEVSKKNYRTWREAAARTTHSRQLRAYLQAEMAGPTGARVHQLVRENAKLISSVSIEAAEHLVHEIQTAQQNGARPGTISKMAQKRFPELLKSRTNLISRTETAKASAALTRARAERIGCDWYIWESSKDQRTRKSHKNMHGVVVPFSHPPSPEALLGEKSTLGNYAAGECPNCRCLTLVVLTLDDITFPARVYWSGAIKQMTKQAFKQVAVGLEERTAS